MSMKMTKVWHHIYNVIILFMIKFNLFQSQQVKIEAQVQQATLMISVSKRSAAKGTWFMLS